MLSRHIALLIASVALVLAGCDSEPAPIRTPLPSTTAAATAEAPVAEPADPAELLALPAEAHALKSLQALASIPSSVTVIVATANPAELMATFAVDAPPEADFGPLRTPELEDLHPTRLKAIGFDPAKPVGFALAAEQGAIGSSWWVFGTVADEEAFVDAFNLKKTAQGYSTMALDLRRFTAYDNGEVVIASRAPSDDVEVAWLSEDAGFANLSNALDYGSLLTLYRVSRRGGALAGFGATDDGAAMRAVAMSSSDAATLRLKFPEELAAIFPEVPMIQRAVVQKQELSARGQSLRANITKLERAPQQRRVAAAKSLLVGVDDIASMEQDNEEIFTASRRWTVTPSQFAALYEGWRELGLTPDERVEIADLNAELELVREEGTSALTHEDIAKATTDAIMGMAKNPQGTMSKLGPLGAMSGQLFGALGDDDDSSGGPLGALGGLGGALGGGGPEPDIVPSSKEPALARHARGKVTELAFCWARSKSAQSPVKSRANLAVDETGAVKVTNVTGPEEMRPCIRKALGARATKPEAPISGTVTIDFRFK